MKIWTDGSCIGNPGPGGWAWLNENEESESGREENSTNNRMELAAVLEALRYHSEYDEVEIITDSKYITDCFRFKWWSQWVIKGWVTSNKQPVKNRDLWEPLIEIVRNKNVTFTWVKGHSTDENNNRVDRIARETAEDGTGT